MLVDSANTDAAAASNDSAMTAATAAALGTAEFTRSSLLTSEEDAIVPTVSKARRGLVASKFSKEDEAADSTSLSHDSKSVRRCQTEEEANDSNV